MKQKKTQKEKRQRRHAKIRAKISGTAKVPRLAVFKSNRYMYAQVIDDAKGTTLASVSSLGMKGKNMAAQAKEVGLEIAKKALDRKIKKVAFDRGGFLYSGKVKILANSAREAGLKF